MQKKCTNSKCRKTFRFDTEQITVRCPHCGKKYPRLAKGNRFIKRRKLICYINGQALDVSWFQDEGANRIQMKKNLRIQLRTIPELDFMMLRDAVGIVEYYESKGAYPAHVYVTATDVDERNKRLEIRS